MSSHDIEKSAMKDAPGAHAMAPSIQEGGDGKASDVVADIVHAAEGEYTSAQYAKVLQRADWILLPLMWIVSGTQYADKVSVSTQATFGLRTDTGLVGQQYSWLSSVFYIAYLLAEAPGNYLMQKVNIRYMVSISMLIWGVLVLCIAFCRNFAELMVVRTLQGIAECTTYPALLVLTASWYTTEEHSSRVMVWGTANAGMDVITSLINYGIGMRAKQDPTGLAPWKGISLFLGSLTIVLSVIVYLVFGTPREVRWLSAEEKRIAYARVVASQTGSDAQERTQWRWDQVRASFRDPQLYFVFFFVVINSIPNGGVTAFGNLVYVSFGFSSLDTIVKGKIPQQLLSIAVFAAAGILTRKKANLRMYVAAFSVVPSFAGMLGLALLPKTGHLWTRWGVYFITSIGNVAAPMTWTLIPSNIAGRTKKSVISTVLLIAYCTGNTIGAQVFQEKDAPRYIPAIVVCSVMYGLQFVILSIWRLYYIRQNRKRDAMLRDLGMSEEDAKHQGRLNAESDMTDVENIHFRYNM
ncbi:hypothetical protein E8E14_005182 [Neopestalotiopsis sp. 37M]|nr:hypothetical protein E8E14_005182 [Neopestalotiopsis sp. 37M]